MIPRTRAEWAITGAAGVLLLLLLFLFAYSHPHSDDFSYDYFLRHKGYFPASAYIYQYSGGRFFSTFLILLSPLYYKSILGYRILTAALFLLFVLSIYIFCKSVTTGNYTRKGVTLLLTAILFLSFCSFTDNLHEFAYWLCAEATYLAAAALWLSSLALHILLAQPRYEKKTSLWVLCILVTILLCGCSEAGLLLNPVPMLLHGLYRREIRKPHKGLYLVIAIFVVLAAYITLSPGNLNRHSQTPFAGNIVLALGGGLYAAFTALLGWALPLLAVSGVYSIVIAPYLIQVCHVFRHSAVFRARNIFWAGLTFFSLCQVGAVWMSGSVPEQRFENVFFLFLLLTCLFSVQLHCSRPGALQQKGPARYALPLLIILYVFFPNNFSKALTDLFSGKAAAYSRENEARYAYISGSSEDMVRVPAIRQHPRLLYYPTLSCNPVRDDADVPRRAMADYFGKKWIYEYPCSPKKAEHPLKTFLKQRREALFSDKKH